MRPAVISLNAKGIVIIYIKNIYPLNLLFTKIAKANAKASCKGITIPEIIKVFEKASLKPCENMTLIKFSKVNPNLGFEKANIKACTKGYPINTIR